MAVGGQPIVMVNKGDRLGAPDWQTDLTLNYDFTMVKGAANVLFGGTGLFIDTFSARRGLQHRRQGCRSLGQPGVDSNGR